MHFPVCYFSQLVLLPGIDFILSKLPVIADMLLEMCTASAGNYHLDM